jgi:hypothetical protein
MVGMLGLLVVARRPLERVEAPDWRSRAERLARLVLDGLRARA